MATIFPAPKPIAVAIRSSSADPNSRSPVADGIRKRRTPSEEANGAAMLTTQTQQLGGADVAGGHQNSAFDYNGEGFVDAEVGFQNPTTADLSNGRQAAAAAPKSENVGFLSRWKSDGSAANRLANLKDSFKNLLTWRRPSSIRCWPFGRRRRQATQYRTVIPNHLVPRQISGQKQQAHPNRRYSGNKINTTKYTMLTFLPKNLFEQFHRFANLYFVFIVLLNWIPKIEAFAKELSMIPVLFVLAVTAIKDIFEDRRRYLSDRKVNHANCRVYDELESRYSKKEWKDIIVGDFVHLSCNEIIPADILLVRSSDPMGVCYVETSNLDGESNLKQRHVITSLLDKQGESFSPLDFKSTVECEPPNNQIYKFNGFLLHQDGQREAVNKNNLLLRGCEVRNTDYIEGIVVYAGHETKAMLNNSGPRYKRSKLERLMNWDIVWCVVILLVMCFVGALGGGIWLASFEDPYSVPYLFFLKSERLNTELEGFLVFWTFIIILQVMIPISLYVSIEIVKLGQIFFITQDPNLYYHPAKKRIQCRALNIPEELGQIQYVMSDKTGTLTENQMIFRRCAVAGVDYGCSETNSTKEQTDFLSSQAAKETSKDVRPNINLQKLMIAACSEETSDAALAGGDNNRRQALFDFFINMAICNTVVVNPHPHSDRMNASGYVADESAGSSSQDASTISYQGNGDGNGLLLKVADASTPIKQTPVDFPSPRYAVPIETVQNQKSKGDFAATSAAAAPLPTIVTSDHAATTGSSGDNTSEDDILENDQNAAANSSNQIANGIGNGHGTGHDRSSENGSLPGNDTSKFRPTTLQFRKKLLQLPTLAKSRLPAMGGKKSQTGTPSVSPGYRNPVYEAESPDELALVYASAAYGFRLVKRQLNSITVELPNAQLLKYEVLHILPFDSVRKRMSVIVKHPTTKKIWLFCKGADGQVIEALSSQFCQSQRGQMYVYKSQEYLNLYASYGLRTLCLAKRELLPDEYEKWSAQHADAEMSLDDDREQLIFESALRIEKDLELLGVSGIEDRLQDGVADCISALRQGGIKVWVLTGDKIETAVNIAYACKLFAYGMELIQLCTRSEADADTLLQHHLDQVTRRNLEFDSGDMASLRNDNLGLVVDGQTLAYFLTPKLEEKFVQLVSRCTSVLCCRATPLQKASVVRLVKEKLEGTTLAVGDGANDVSMLQCADVGVGLSGQEGMQAVMASDFAMPQFRFLQRLLLVHGHWCYDRLARMVLYFFYKNAMFVFTLFWYQFFNGFTAQCMIDPLYLQLHNLVFTSAPPLLLGVFDQDAPGDLLFEQHILYRQGPKAQLYRAHSFWLNIFDALWQSIVCYFVPHFLYIETSKPMVGFAFLIQSALVICNQCHLLVDLRSWTLPIIVSILLSVLVFYGFALSYNALSLACCAPDSPYWVAQHMIVDSEYWLALLIIVVLALFPRFVCVVMKNTFFPTDVLKARTRLRLKIKSAKSDKVVPWMVRFTSKTKSVSFLRTTPQPAAAAPSETANGNATGTGDQADSA